MYFIPATNTSASLNVQSIGSLKMIGDKVQLQPSGSEGVDILDNSGSIYHLPKVAPSTGQIMVAQLGGDLLFVDQPDLTGFVQNPMISNLDSGVYQLNNASRLQVVNSANSAESCIFNVGDDGAGNSAVYFTNPQAAAGKYTFDSLVIGDNFSTVASGTDFNALAQRLADLADSFNLAFGTSL